MIGIKNKFFKASCADYLEFTPEAVRKILTE